MIKIRIKNENTLYDTAELFKVFGDSTRLRILYTLCNGEKSVNEISNILNMNQSAISHQLKLLKTNKLVKNRKDGKTVYYTLADNHVLTILSQGIEHIEE